MSTWNWSVGVTTAGRKQPTLDRTLTGLAQAGWERPRLFADADACVHERWARLPSSRRDEQLGAFANWYLALAEMVMRNPHADGYLLCQDDVIFCRGLRAYLERSLWPAERIGVVSLFCPTHFGRGKPKGFHVEDRGWDAAGAQAYLFSYASAEALLASPLVLRHRHSGPAGGSRNIDSIVGLWCRETRLPYFVHVPSLVEHVGATSTIYRAAGLWGNRAAADFVGETYDVSTSMTHCKAGPS
jgi:hypothetical protein